VKRSLLSLSLFLLAGRALAQAPSPYPPPQPPGQVPPPPGYGQPPPPGYGQPPPGYGQPYREATFHRHLGFFLQMDLGIAGQKATWSDSVDGSQKLSGGGGAFSIAIGGAVAENLILAGHLWGYSAFEPDYTVGGQRFSTSGSELSLGLSGIGLNLTYYLMPSNVYLSITPSIATVSLQQNGVQVESDSGFGLRLAVGKEWWVSDHWGLGLNGQVAFASNRPGGGGSNIESAAFAIAFSASYN